MFFQIALAQWSLNRSFFSKKIDNLDFPAIARKQYDIGAVEYVNQFFMDKAENTAYLNELLNRCRDNEVKNHLIMCDHEGMLADSDNKARIKAIENHYKWVHAAKYLGCATIRVNTYGTGTPDEIKNAGADSLNRLGEYAEKEAINIVVENHGGITSNGEWLASLIKKVNRKNVGTLPDFGNFCLQRSDSGCEKEYDRYKGVTELIPFAKTGVSAKAHKFDKEGNCIETDYTRMLRIIKEAGFTGYMGIEYEGGDNASEEEGIRKTKTLLERTAVMIDY